MPDQLERIAMMRGALEVAAADPVRVQRASADDWIAERLAGGLRAGTATVVFHSVFWIYPPAEVTDPIRATIEAAGATATADAPLHWLRYEEGAERMGVVELRLRSWPGGGDELLATGGHHYRPLDWLGGSAS
jgi:hypothetical protein